MNKFTLKNIKKNLELSKQILNNLLVFADFENSNGAARAFKILTAITKKIEDDLDNEISDKKLWIIDRNIVLSKYIKYYKLYLKNLVIDMNFIKYKFMDVKKTYQAITSLKKKLKSKKIIHINEDGEDFIYFDNLKTLLSLDINKKEPFLKIVGNISKIFNKDTVYFNSILDLLKEVNNNVKFEQSKVTSYYSDGSYEIDFYIRGGKLTKASYNEKTFNELLIDNIISENLVSIKLYSEEELNELKSNLKCKLKLSIIKEY